MPSGADVSADRYPPLQPFWEHSEVDAACRCLWDLGEIPGELVGDAEWTWYGWVLWCDDCAPIEKL